MIFFNTFPAHDQAILANHILGGFQNESKKSKWDLESSNKCPLCHQVDDQRHRFLDCKCFENLRNNHKEAIRILEDIRPNWIYHPVAVQSDETSLIVGVLQAIPPVESSSVVQNSTKHHRYFTDGACENPTHSNIRRSAWAVVQDLSNDSLDREREAALVSPYNWQVPHFKTVVTGFTHGHQSPARAELLALWHACEHAIAAEQCESAEFIVDAQYVINVIKTLNYPMIPWHKVANSDIVRKLQSCWNKKTFSLTKIKSHRDIREATSMGDLWNLLGNHFADIAAGKALNNIPQEFKELIEKVKKFQLKEKDMLRLVLSYFSDLDKARNSLLQQSKKLVHAEHESSQHDNALFGDAIQKLADYRVVHGYNHINGALQEDHANSNLQGSGIAYAVWWWAGQLVWPEDNPPNGNSHPVSKWGITWFELLVNFIVTTGWYPPLRISGMGSSSIYISYVSNEGHMQLPSKRAASRLTSSFQSLVQCVQSLSQTTILPVKPRINSAALRRLGYQGKCLTSLPIRPQIPCADETMRYVAQYIQKLDGSVALKLPVDDISVVYTFEPPSDVILVDDAGTRYRNYQSLITRRRNGR